MGDSEIHPNSAHGRGDKVAELEAEVPGQECRSIRGNVLERQVVAKTFVFLIFSGALMVSGILLAVTRVWTEMGLPLALIGAALLLAYWSIRRSVRETPGAKR